MKLVLGLLSSRTFRELCKWYVFSFMDIVLHMNCGSSLLSNLKINTAACFFHRISMGSTPVKFIEYYIDAKTEMQNEFLNWVGPHDREISNIKLLNYAHMSFWLWWRACMCDEQNFSMNLHVNGNYFHIGFNSIWNHHTLKPIHFPQRCWCQWPKLV